MGVAGVYGELQRGAVDGLNQLAARGRVGIPCVFEHEATADIFGALEDWLEDGLCRFEQIGAQEAEIDVVEREKAREWTVNHHMARAQLFAFGQCIQIAHLQHILDERIGGAQIKADKGAMNAKPALIAIEQGLVSGDEIILIIIQHRHIPEILQFEGAVFLKNPVFQESDIVISEGSAQNRQGGHDVSFSFGPFARWCDAGLFDPSAHEALNKLSLEKQEANQKRRRGEQGGRIDHRPFNPGIGRRENGQANG